MTLRFLLLLTALPAAACSSIIEGTSQQIVVNTNPPGAACRLMRQGEPLATINPTPGSTLIKKTKYDITVVCDKPGYVEATYMNHSGAAGATFGNLILGGAVGWAIDSASGADNKYDSPVNLTLTPPVASGAAPALQATAAVPAAVAPVPVVPAAAQLPTPREAAATSAATPDY